MEIIFFIKNHELLKKRSKIKLNISIPWWTLCEWWISVCSKMENTTKIDISISRVTIPDSTSRCTIFTTSLELWITSDWVECIVNNWFNIKSDSTKMCTCVGQTSSLWWSTVGIKISITDGRADSKSSESTVSVETFDVSVEK